MSNKIKRLEFRVERLSVTWQWREKGGTICLRYVLYSAAVGFHRSLRLQIFDTIQYSLRGSSIHPTCEHASVSVFFSVRGYFYRNEKYNIVLYNDNTRRCERVEVEENSVTAVPKSHERCV